MGRRLFAGVVAMVLVAVGADGLGRAAGADPGGIPALARAAVGLALAGVVVLGTWEVRRR